MAINYTHPNRLNGAAWLAREAKRAEELRRLITLYVYERSSTGGSSRRTYVMRKGETINLTQLARVR